MSQLIKSLYIGSCLPEWYVGEYDFTDAQEEHRGEPIKFNFTSWRRHILFNTGE